MSTGTSCSSRSPPTTPRRADAPDLFVFTHAGLLVMPLLLLFFPARRAISASAWRQLAARRLLPVIFFGAPLAFAAVGVQRSALPPYASADARELAVDTCRGGPDLDWVTWFPRLLVLPAEPICARWSRKKKSSPERDGVAFGLAASSVGVWFSNVSAAPRRRQPLHHRAHLFLASNRRGSALCARPCRLSVPGRWSSAASVWVALVGGLRRLAPYLLHPRAGIVNDCGAADGDALPFPRDCARRGAVFGPRARRAAQPIELDCARSAPTPCRGSVNALLFFVGYAIDSGQRCTCRRASVGVRGHLAPR